jgi:rhamnose utilization protein RhaD (predicted bifunctional aldolase and dehydrogenase)
MSLDAIIELSHEFGSNPDWVLGGGGNTSYKEDGKLYIKASGVALGDIDADGFVRMDADRLDRIWDKVYPSNPEDREAQVLADLMAARSTGEEHKRPSVETLMHALFPQTFIVHSHPALANAVTCAAEGRAYGEKIFGEEMMWIESVNPGFILAHRMREETEAYREKHGRYPEIVLMENHGLVICATTAEEIRRKHEEVRQKLLDWTETAPAFKPVQSDKVVVHTYLEAVRAATHEKDVVFSASDTVLEFLSDREHFAPLEIAYTPDHMIYSGERPLYIEKAASSASSETDASVSERLTEEVSEYRRKFNADPKIVAVSGLGFFAAEMNEKMTDLAKKFFLDEMKIAKYAEPFGGIKPLPEAQRNFIANWEVERYRRKVSESNG